MAQQRVFFLVIYRDNFYWYVLGKTLNENDWLIEKFSAIKLLQPCGF